MIRTTENELDFLLGRKRLCRDWAFGVKRSKVQSAECKVQSAKCRMQNVSNQSRDGYGAVEAEQSSKFKEQSSE